MIAYLVGDDAMASYEAILREELAPAGLDLRAPRWRIDDVAPGTTLRVAVVGAGMSGLAAAHRLRQVGAEVTVFEKNTDVGGTWFENIYPGCRVDVPNHLYSYSFAQTTEWPEFFSAQQSLLDYFRWVADSLDLRSLIRFSTEVESVTYDDDRNVWTLVVKGTGETLEFDAVCSAVGQLNRPNWPDIAGHRVVRRTVLPLGRVGLRHRPHRQARRRHRDGRVRRAVHPRRRGGGRRRRRLPAHGAVARAVAELPRPPRRRAALVARGAAGLRPMGPHVAVLAHARGTARGGQGRSRTGKGTASARSAR